LRGLVGLPYPVFQPSKKCELRQGNDNDDDDDDDDDDNNDNKY
jgi:hypothetical protein